jgi:hypothetical protein
MEKHVNEEDKKPEPEAGDDKVPLFAVAVTKYIF